MRRDPRMAAQAIPVPPMAYSPQMVVTQLGGAIVSKVVLAVVDRFIFPEPDLRDLRDTMIQVIDESEPQVNAIREKMLQSRAMRAREEGVPRNGLGPETLDAVGYIQASIDALNSARRATNCKVCQDEIGAAVRDVERRLSTIQSTDRVYHTMKDMERQGELPRGKRWSTLKETERERVRRRVKELM